MLACIDITKPMFKISEAKLATQKISNDMVLQKWAILFSASKANYWNIAT